MKRTVLFFSALVCTSITEAAALNKQWSPQYADAFTYALEGKVDKLTLFNTYSKIPCTHLCDQQGATLLHYAGTPNMIQYLLSLGIPLSAHDKHGRDPVNYAFDRLKQNPLNAMAQACIKLLVQQYGVMCDIG